MSTKKLGTINISNRSDKTVTINIEGIIGIPEWWQFDDATGKVSTYEKFTTKVNKIKEIKAGKVIVNIRSLGGNVNHALLIHDALQLLDAEVTTVCFGYPEIPADMLLSALVPAPEQPEAGNQSIVNSILSGIKDIFTQQNKIQITKNFAIF